MKKSYYEFWAKQFLKDGMKAIKTIIGLGLVVTLSYYINLGVGILFFGWVLIESLLDKN